MTRTNVSIAVRRSIATPIEEWNSDRGMAQQNIPLRRFLFRNRCD
jgi:hypothetical protein